MKLIRNAVGFVLILLAAGGFVLTLVLLVLAFTDTQGSSSGVFSLCNFGFLIVSFVATVMLAKLGNRLLAQ